MASSSLPNVTPAVSIYNLPLMPPSTQNPVSYPHQPAPGAPLTRGPAAALLWGAFLGCSWTWIIGMIFPAMLLRDYGLPGWVAFATPNVLGAAAMGAVLYKPQWSVHLVQRHLIACHNFTVVTVAFHLYVIAWLFSSLFGLAAMPMMVIAIGLCVALGMRNRASAMLWVAAGVWLISIGCFVWAVSAGGSGGAGGVGADQGAWSLASWQPQSPRLSERDLWYFLPCSVLGFLLCPYLDLTFHRARINTTPKTGVFAFALGFGGVFFTMIIFSLVYGAQLLPLLEGQPGAGLPRFWLIPLAIHLTLQAGFTITVHVREAIEDHASGGLASLPWMVAAGGIAIVMGFIAKLTGLPDPQTLGGALGRLAGDLSWGETGYRAFLLLYATVFPAYVWLVMIPARRRLSPLGKELRNALYAICCAIAYALGWMAFVLGRPGGVPIIFGVLIAARLAIEFLPRQKDGA